MSPSPRARRNQQQGVAASVVGKDAMAAEREAPGAEGWDGVPVSPSIQQGDPHFAGMRTQMMENVYIFSSFLELLSLIDDADAF